MLKIYHVTGTRGVRPIWLCHELGLQVEVETIDFSPTYRATPGWRAISPAGKVPILTDGDLTLFESGAMVDYILERYGRGRLRPMPGTAESGRYLQWCWFAEATLVRPLGLPRLLKDQTETGASLVADGVEKAETCLSVVEDTVTRSDYLLGSAFSAADIMMGFSLHLMTQVRILDDRFPAAEAYLQRLRAREGFARALAA